MSEGREEIAVADIGGTNARFALAETGGGRAPTLGEVVTLKVAEHASLLLAWRAFAAAARTRAAAPRRLRRRLPRARRCAEIHQ